MARQTEKMVLIMKGSVSMNDLLKVYSYINLSEPPVKALWLLIYIFHSYDAVLPHFFYLELF